MKNEIKMKNGGPLHLAVEIHKMWKPGSLLLRGISRDIHLVDLCSDLCLIWDTFVSDTLFLPDRQAYFSTPSLPSPLVAEFIIK